MLKNFTCGWCDIEIFGCTFNCASYLEDYPIDIAYALIASINGESSEFVVDMEERGQARCTIRPCEFIVVQDDGAIARIPITQEDIRNAISDLADDIERDLDAVVEWCMPDDKLERAERYMLVNKTIDELRRAA